MNFEGTFEDLSLVDVLKLLHATRNEGILFVKGVTGEARLAIRDGFAVVAYHPEGKPTVGQVLVDMEAITRQRLIELETVAAKEDPVLSSLELLRQLRITGEIDPATSWQAQERVVEATMMEILSWEKGAFRFQVGTVESLDDFRLVSREMGVDIPGLDIQRSLLAAMRALNRKISSSPPAHMRLGPQERPTRPGELGAWARATASERSYDSFQPFSSEDTTIDALIETPLLGVESRGSASAPRPALRGRRPALSSVPSIPVMRERRSATSRIGEGHRPPHTGESGKDAVAPPPSTSPSQTGDLSQLRQLILFVSLPGLKEALSTWCLEQEITLRAADTELEVYQHIHEGQSNGMVPVVLLELIPNDDDEFWIERSKSLMHRLRRMRPDLQVAAICEMSPAAQREAYELGVSYPLPCPSGDEETAYSDDLVRLVTSCLDAVFLQRRDVVRDVVRTRRQISILKGRMSEITAQGDVTEISLVVLRYLSAFLERCVIFVVRNDRLCAVGAFGLSDKQGVPHTISSLNIPLVVESPVRRIVRDGVAFIGECDDSTVLNPLYEAIGAPNFRDVILLPLRASGRTIALIYGDYGAGRTTPLWLEPLEVLALQAGLALENVMLRQELHPLSGPPTAQSDPPEADLSP